MKNTILLLAACLVFSLGSNAQQKSIAERLGYPQHSKLLILHADDLGVAHSENAASIATLEKGPLNSASIMVPCSWFPEIAAYARKNKQLDFGIHTTLTSEWKNYKWGPVTSKDSVASIVNKHGYFYASVDSVQQFADPKEVELELRNQVKKAYQFGIYITHLDTHMGAAASTPAIVAAYMKVGKEFGLPVLLDGRAFALEDDAINKLMDSKTVIVDRILSMDAQT